ncbi:MAG: HEAT repeat domain-containing protein [Elusimicrobia bacterium]|nr:HEAT repeat domain-containing protein [Elusimicrobiota bacterium]
MKFLAVIALVAALAFVAYQRGMFTPAPPPPPPPPPPPAILNEPAPVISEVELQKVLKSAQDPEPNVRWEAVVFLDKVKAPQAMPLMREMLQKDMEASLRIKIIDLLANRKGEEVLTALVASMKDQEPEVRLEALKALEKIGNYSVAGAITEGPLRDSEESVRLQAMRTLNSLQDKKQKEIEEARVRYEQDKAAAEAAARAAQKK